MPPEAPRIAFADSACVFATWRNVMIAYFVAPANALRMRAFRSTQRELSKQTDPVGCMVIQDLNRGSNGVDISEELRAEVSAAISAYNDRDLSVAVSIEGAGLLAAASRSLVSGLMLIARPSYPMKIFGTRQDSSAWLLKSMRGTRPVSTTDELVAATVAATNALKL